ncbi:MAG: hypothetical protein MHM6MM_005417, partial [Cercozoa sp. M6MM]
GELAQARAQAHAAELERKDGEKALTNAREENAKLHAQIIKKNEQLQQRVQEVEQEYQAEVDALREQLRAMEDNEMRGTDARSSDRFLRVYTQQARRGTSTKMNRWRRELSAMAADFADLAH